MISSLRYLWLVFASAGISTSVGFCESPEAIIGKVASSRNELKVIRCVLEVDVEITMLPDPTENSSGGTNKNFRYKQIRTGAIDFRTGKYRWDTEGTNYEPSKFKVFPYRGASTFDGMVLRSVKYPLDGQTSVKPGTAVASDFAEFRGNLSQQAFRPEMHPLFLSFGILPAANQHPLFPGRFHTYSVALNGDTFQHSVKPLQAPKGVWLDTMMAPSPKSDNYMQYCFAEPNYSLLYAAWIIGGKPAFISTFQYQNSTNQRSLKGWTYKTFVDGNLVGSHTVKVQKLDHHTDFDESLLKLSPDPGMVLGRVDTDRGSG